jgi:Family of unknown function (DUF5318)
VSFRADSLRSSAGGGARAGVVDHRLARRALITEYRKGRLARHQVCDAHPELIRAARGIGRETTTECPICEDDRLVHVTYVFGPLVFVAPPRAHAAGRCPPALSAASTSVDGLVRVVAAAGEAPPLHLVEAGGAAFGVPRVRRDVEAVHGL